MAPTPDEPAVAPVAPASPETVDEPGGRVTVVLPVQRRPAPPPAAAGRVAPLVVVAAVNALWAALLSFLPILATVAAATLVGSGRPPIGATVRYSLAGWLLAHGVPLRIDGQPIALIPLAVTAVAIWRCLRAGRNTVRAIGARRADSVRPALGAAAAVAVGYGLIGAGTAVLARGPGLGIDPLRAGATLGAFALVTTFLGGWARSRFARRWWLRVPRVVRDGLRTGVVAAMVLIAAGAAAVGASVATSGSTATVMLRNMHLGFVGQAGIVLVCLAYAPNVAVWASAYLAGPGFTLAGVPELPVFAGLPSHAVTGPGQALLATPVLAGCVAGILLARRRARLRGGADARAAVRAARATGAVGTDDPSGRDTVTEVDADPSGSTAATPGDGDANGAERERAGRGGSRTSLAMAAVLAGPAAAGALAAAGYLAAGALGSEALAGTGQVGWEFAVIAGIGIGLGALVGACVAA